jgi:hypothetical protein
MSLSLAQRLVPPVEVELAGERRALLYTNDALLRCQDLTGIDMLQPLRLGSITARVLVALLWCGIGQPVDLPIRELGSGIRPRATQALREAVRAAWIASMPEPKPRRAGKGDARDDGPQTWIRLWARARYELGLSDVEWLGMTSRQVSELYLVRAQQLKRENLLVGKLGAAIVNARVKKPITPEQFLGIEPDEESGGRKGKVTGEDIMAALAGFKKVKA